MLGESLSVKGSQLAYLVPAALLKTGSKVSASNPMNYDDYIVSEPDEKDDDQQLTGMKQYPHGVEKVFRKSA